MHANETNDSQPADVAGVITCGEGAAHAASFALKRARWLIRKPRDPNGCWPRS
jgi:hypothetical protein